MGENESPRRKLFLFWTNYYNFLRPFMLMLLAEFDGGNKLRSHNQVRRQFLFFQKIIHNFHIGFDKFRKTYRDRTMKIASDNHKPMKIWKKNNRIKRKTFDE